jgi:hypothetical protein
VVGTFGGKVFDGKLCLLPLSTASTTKTLLPPLQPAQMALMMVRNPKTMTSARNHGLLSPRYAWSSILLLSHYKFSKLTLSPKLLNEGKFKTVPVHILEGGDLADRLERGLVLSKEGKMGGKKAVVLFE